MVLFNVFGLRSLDVSVERLKKLRREVQENVLVRIDTNNTTPEVTFFHFNGRYIMISTIENKTWFWCILCILL